ncbi:MAG: TetR/AcrR family transcriptional regulator [Marinomonas sp.]|uniref:TetR/AcrR family transcriptional regulator n=1 Tax=Marinomonas sp. TaxID=1904862 RepID=UPI003F97BE0A
MKQKRMTASRRFEQLLECALEVLKEDGADGLTLGRVAQKAGVTKPIVYGHFESRAGLLSVLYQNYCQRHLQATQDALADVKDSNTAANALARCYIECVLSSDSLSLAVDAALDGSAETEKVKQDCDDEMMTFWEESLQKFEGKTASKIAFIAFSGAAKSLSKAISDGFINQKEAEVFLANLLTK